MLKAGSSIPEEIIRSRSMSVVVKVRPLSVYILSLTIITISTQATEVTSLARSSLVVVNIPVAGDENSPQLTSDFYIADIVTSEGGAYSLDPELSLVAEDPDPFPVNKEFSFELIGDKSHEND